MFPSVDNFSENAALGKKSRNIMAINRSHNVTDMKQGMFRMNYNSSQPALDTPELPIKERINLFMKQ